MRLREMVADLPEGEPTSPTYETFYIYDRNNLSGQAKRRMIEQPNTGMRTLHQRLRKCLKPLVARLPYATGAVNGGSPYRNVLRHRYNRYFFLTDIHGAYVHVDMTRLATVLYGLIPEIAADVGEVEIFLLRYCQSKDSGLATGAPASPDLFNLYAAELLDKRLGAYCEERGITYSRYLDDLTFSTQVPFGKTKRRAILRVITEAGFTVSSHKTHVYDLAKGTIEINGIGLELGGRIFLPRQFLRLIDGLLNQALLYGDTSPQRIAGMISVFWSVVGESKHLRHLGLNRTEQKVARKISRWQEQQQRRRARNKCAG